MNRSGLAILVSACALLFAQPAFAATTRYAAPSGSGTTCSPALPCDLVSAATGLVSGDSVQVAPGTYNLGPTSLPLQPGVSLIGAPGPRPTITAASAIGSAISASNAVVKHLAVTQTGGGAGAISSTGGSTLEDLVLTSAGTGVNIGPGDLLRNSVVRLTGASGLGIGAGGIGLGSVSNVRNVLISAPGVSTVGIQANGFCMPFFDPMNPTVITCGPGSAQPVISVRNSIIRAATDVVTSGMSGATGTVNLAYSDYRAAKTTASPAGTIVDGGGNIASDPLFADATNGDFHALAGSPTIDAGDPLASSDSLVGALDLDGLTRIVGGRIDLGPFEFVPSQSSGTGDGGGSLQSGGGSTNPPAGGGTDAGGGSGATADKTAPVIRSLRMKPGVLRKSALVTYLVSEKGTTTLTIARKTSGVKKGRTCAKAGGKVKKGAKRCTLWVAVRGSISHADAGGKSSLVWTGKLRGKRLAAGTYRLIAVARDGAGNRGAPVTVTFRVSKG